MFKRRNPLPLHQRAGGIIWPRGGWKRSGAYVAHRLRRLPGTPYRIAAGFASGAAVSFTPFIGLHFVLAAALAVVVRGNVIAAAIGTVVGNPWTFPFIWVWIYTLGRWILGGADDLTALPANLSFQHMLQHPLQVLLPMVIGGIPTAVVAWFAFFWPLQRTIAEYQKARRRRLLKRMQRERDRAAKAAAGSGGKADPIVETRKFERQL